jgi:hypothetical protein
LLQINKSWDYLLELKIYTLTEEKILELEAKMKSMFMELDILKETKIETLWNSELMNLQF